MRGKACAVLQHLSANPDNARDLLRAGTVDVLAHELHREDDDASCRKRAIAALINLSFVAPSEPSLVDPELLNRLAVLQQRPGLAEHVCALLHNLSVVREHRPELARAGPNPGPQRYP